LTDVTIGQTKYVFYKAMLVRLRKF